MAIQVQNDHTAEVLAKLKAGIRQALEESGNIIENAAADRAPVDTGRLKNSITHQVTGDTEVQIGSAVEYAKYVECGTSRMGAKPYLKPAATESVGKVEQAFKNALGS